RATENRIPALPVDRIHGTHAAHRLEFFRAGPREHRLTRGQVGQHLVTVDANTRDLTALVAGEPTGHSHTVGGATAMLSLAAAVQPRNLLDLKVERFRDPVQAAN